MPVTTRQRQHRTTAGAGSMPMGVASMVPAAAAESESAPSTTPATPPPRKKRRSVDSAIAPMVTPSPSQTGAGTNATKKRRSGVSNASPTKKKLTSPNDNNTPLASSSAKRRSVRSATAACGTPMQTPSSPASTTESKKSTSSSLLSTKTKSTSQNDKKKETEAASKAKVTARPPEGWRDVYALVEELRQDRTAPCDHSGCEALPDASREHDPVQFRFQVLISLMLSSQTKDAVVGSAIRSMQADGVLDVRSIATMGAPRLQSYIAKVGFHNNKTRYIQEAVQILLDKYNGDIPATAAEMIRDLPGVGPKMAYICESVAWKTTTGIGVDTHMHRLFNKLGWVQNCKTPEHTRIQLESWLPQEYWMDVNLLWVGFGQEVQQEKEKVMRKALHCSRPGEALRLLKRCGLDYIKVGKEIDLMDEIHAAELL
jgi:endonuclease III